MPISMSAYKVVYKDRVYRTVAIASMYFKDEFKSDGRDEEPESITVLVIDENGNIKHITDETKRFQFIPVVQA